MFIPYCRIKWEFFQWDLFNWSFINQFNIMLWVKRNIILYWSREKLRGRDFRYFVSESWFVIIKLPLWILLILYSCYIAVNILQWTVFTHKIFAPETCCMSHDCWINIHVQLGCKLLIAHLYTNKTNRSHETCVLKNLKKIFLLRYWQLKGCNFYIGITVGS